MKSLSVFMAQVVKELQKIHWPAQEEFVSAVIYTLILVFAFSCFFAVVDTAISYVVRAILFATT